LIIKSDSLINTYF